MKKPLLGQRVAVLVANGFLEKDFTLVQRMLMSAGADVRIVNMDSGLVNSWNGEGWGLNFAADQALNQALAIDFTMLVVPGGQRSIEKLKLTAHTRRFLNGFLNSKKPVALIGDALSLLAFSGQGTGHIVSGHESLREGAEAVGAQWSDAPYSVEGHLMSGCFDDESQEAYMQAILDFFLRCHAESKELAEAA